MSTYYFAVCDDHKQRCDAASVTSGVGALGHSHMLRTFLVEHCNCNGLRITNEYEDGIHDYAEPYANVPDPEVKEDSDKARLLERLHNAEMQVRRMKKLYES